MEKDQNASQLFKVAQNGKGTKTLSSILDLVLVGLNQVITIISRGLDKFFEIEIKS